MSLPALLEQRLRLPVVAAPMFLISNPQLVLACCRNGVVGSFPALNQRESSGFKAWLEEIEAGLALLDNPAPYAVNLIVHNSNPRVEADLAICVEHKVPIVITSLGAVQELVDAVHSYGGLVFHDIINNFFAKKAIEKGADGLIAVAAGAGGHAGTQSPFALVQEIREWFDGPVLLSGSIAKGDASLGAQAMGADLAYIGSAFIATDEANADERYKQSIVDSSASDIIYSNLFTGVHGNYLRSSIEAAGLDPNDLPESDPSKMDFGDGSSKAWKDIWGSGQGIGAIKKIGPASELIERLKQEYSSARQRMDQLPWK